METLEHKVKQPAWDHTAGSSDPKAHVLHPNTWSYPWRWLTYCQYLEGPLQPSLCTCLTPTHVSAGRTFRVCHPPQKQVQQISKMPDSHQAELLEMAASPSILGRKSSKSTDSLDSGHQPIALLGRTTFLPGRAGNNELNLLFWLKWRVKIPANKEWILLWARRYILHLILKEM